MIPTNRIAAWSALFCLSSVALVSAAVAPAAHAQKERIQRKPSVIVYRNVRGNVGESVTLEAHLASGATPLGGKKITFLILQNGSGRDYRSIGNATTDEEGNASITYTLTEDLLRGKKQFSVRTQAVFDGDVTPKDGILYNKTYRISTITVYPADTGSPQEGVASGATSSSLPGTSGTVPSPSGPVSGSEGNGNTAPVAQQPGPVQPGQEGIPPNTDPAASQQPDQTAGKPVPGPDQPRDATDEFAKVLHGALLKTLGTKASIVLPSVVSEEAGLKEEAVGLNVHGFQAAYPRFWLEAQLTKLVSEPKKLFGKEVPGSFDTNVEVRFSLSDVLKGSRDEWIERKTKQGFKLSVPINIGGKGTAAAVKGALGSSEQKIALQKVLGSDEGKVLRDALAAGVANAEKLTAACEWMARVVSVSGEKVYISGGNGSGLTVGQKLSIQKLVDTIKDGNKVMDLVLEDLGVVEVSEIRPNVIITKCVTAANIEKGCLATLISTTKASK